VLINDVARKRLLLADASLKNAKVVLDSASNSSTGSIGISVPTAPLIRYTADSTLYVDVATLSLLVIDPSGKIARVMALPKPRDALFMATAQAFGFPGMDPQGRLIYRGQIIIPPKPPEPGERVSIPIPEQPDSGPIVRADFDKRTVDTLGTLKIFKPGSMKLTNDKEGNMKLSMVLSPMDTGDEWAVLPDGTVAIVRAHDYHVDWIAPDGTKSSSPKMPFDWKRMTDEQKQFKIDSIRPEVEKQIAAAPLQTIPTPEGPRKLSMQVEFAPLNQWPDYEPPISPGSVKVDLDGNLWIVPHTSASAAGGLLYDVVNRKGDITMRVQFPARRALAGFGPGGTIYTISTSADMKTAVLERTRLK